LRSRTHPQSDTHGQHLLSHGLVLLFCLTPSVVLALQGLSRPYDAIPDQDLLWVSEALRLIRGVAPSYADHPGAFWTLIFRLNIELSQWIIGTSIIDTAGNITTFGTTLAIQTARLQNAFIAGLCAYLLYPAGVALEISHRVSALMAAIMSLSSALLVGVSEIRHEAASVMFLLLSLITFKAALDNTQKITSRFLTATSVGLFFCAGFSKNQSLLLSPLLLLALACIALSKEGHKGIVSAISKGINKSRIITLIAVSATPWLISAAPDIDLINLPAWAFINLGLSAIISLGWFRELNYPLLLRALAGLSAAEVLMFRVIAPQWWRQAVTGFPSWMARHTIASENPLINPVSQTLSGINRFFLNQFAFSNIAIIAFSLSAIACTIYIAKALIDWRKAPRTDTLAIAMSWLLCSAILIASNQRVPTIARYDLYAFAPLLLTAGASLSKFESSLNLGISQKHFSTLSATCSIIILGCAATKSVGNAADLRAFTNPGQSRENLCIGHHMDQSMQLTSAGQCKNFPKGALDKDIYDSWWGPGR
jgi:hypothetical protein